MPQTPLACPVCTGDLPSSAACSRCGYEELRARPALSLPVGTVLHGEYTVGNPLGKPGGFGITYLAWYNALEQPVAIKEYLPTDLAGRSPDSRTVKSHSLDHEADFRFGIEQFLREARTLARLSHPNIVRVRGFFEENGTAYLVMDYYAGRSLDRLLEERGGRLPEQEAVEILLPILDALQYVHTKNLLHRDVKPSNLYLKEDRTPILLDFGAARSALGERTQSASLVHTPGYAPFEQYHGGGNQGTWTDVYAVAATLYKLLTGAVPPNAIERSVKDSLVPPERLVPGLSPGCSRAVLAGLALQPEKRPRDARELGKLLVVPESCGESSQPRLATPLVFLKPGEVRANSVDGLIYVWIPPGMFQMGCGSGDRECYLDEKPSHAVKITRGFWLSQTEVTVEAYRRFAQATSRPMPEAPSFNQAWVISDHPIVNVEWHDARAFCEWAGGRLPAEAEWEYAARGGLEDRKYPWGEEPPVDRKGASNGARFNSSGPVVVGSYSANGYGLYDMAGNVLEWCADTWHDSYRGAPQDGSAWITEGSSWRVFRGGSWGSLPRNLRVSTRSRYTTDNRNSSIGFRCARDAFP